VSGPVLDRATELELLDRVYAQHEARTTTLAEHGLRVPTSTYTGLEHHELEQRTIFRHDPVFACMSAELPRPGDRRSLTSGGVPVVVTRAADGTVRAYVNVCRHRGAPLVREDAAGERSFVCPFHGWVYDTDTGALVGQPRSCGGFDEVSAPELSLLPVGVAEAHGIVVVRPGGTAAIDVDAWLDGLGPELAGLRYEELRPFRSQRTTWACNWKLLIDTFLESYHVPALHKASLGAAYIGAASPFDAFGRHNRIVVPQAAVLEQQARPRDEWQLLPHVVLQHLLAPNVVISNLQGTRTTPIPYVMTWRFVPDAVDRTTVEHTLLTYGAVTDADERAHFDARFDAARAVTSNEDFPESERVHANLATGTLDATVLGRNEPGVVQFHSMLRDRIFTG
jgi:phenylpropionate dioxygenase-like ring-hydroxylating dioxygenase large terminal subunit